MSIDRRDFLKAVPAMAWTVANATDHLTFASAETPGRVRLETFDFSGVKLLPSRWQKQYESARDFYFNVSDDDILCGFRKAAGLNAPGKTLGGWAERDSAVIFGQWLSGMSRMYHATDDTDIRDKAVKLCGEFAKTVKADGDCRMRHYPFEKLACGLTDLHQYGGYSDATKLLERTTEWASRTFDRTRAPAGPVPWEMHSGKPLEWYTLPENFYRAYLLTKNPAFKDFAEIWLYHDYWNKFADTAAPTNAHGVHAYSHVNTFSSAAMHYAVTGDPVHLRILRNAYDFLQDTQCFATGGYGPAERILPTNGSLGKSLEGRIDTFETPCGSWAGFKFSRYLMQFTGEARYGDWAERLVYNGIGAALPINGAGRHFYYADYRFGAVKYYSRNAYTCCSGTYIQDVADYHNLIYYRDDKALYVNLYIPSEVTWSRPQRPEVKVVQNTEYPEAETSTFQVSLSQSSEFALNFRIPGWAREASITINGKPTDIACKPGNWASVARTWSDGDRIEVRIPLPLRFQAIDRWHPERVAVVRGPVVMTQEGNTHEPVYALPHTDEELNKLLVPDEVAGFFRMAPADGTKVQAKFRPFYSLGEGYPYRMYFDRDKLPFVLWA